MNEFYPGEAPRYRLVRFLPAAMLSVTIGRAWSKFCASLRGLAQWPRTSKRLNQYLFSFLCPPYSGSTLLAGLVSTSAAVSSLPGEGQFIPEVMAVMRRDPWNADFPLPWNDIRRVWHRYWDTSKPILLEKSPPNIIRAATLEKIFQPACFLVMVRNPYAHCEGLMRRNKWSASRAAEFSVFCLQTQAENVEKLARCVSFTYEELAADPPNVCSRISAFLPSLGDLDYSKIFRVHSYAGLLESPIKNLNEPKIARLSPGQMREISNVFARHEAILQRWGYSVLQPDQAHRRRHYRYRFRNAISSFKRAFHSLQTRKV